MDSIAPQAPGLPVEDRREFDDEDPPLSIWFWIVPLVLVLAYVAFFVRHYHPVPAPPTSLSGVNTLPRLGVVQFGSGTPTLTPDGEATLDRAVEAMRGNPNVRIRLQGYDPPGLNLKKRSPSFKERPRDPLTAQRSRSVEKYLDAKGIDANRLTGIALSPSVQVQPTAFPDPDVDSRRAELYVR